MIEFIIHSCEKRKRVFLGLFKDDVESGQSRLYEVFQLTEKFSVEDKAKLIELLLGKQAGLKVVLDDNPLTQVISQIYLMDRNELSELLKAIAKRLASEGKQVV